MNKFILFFLVCFPVILFGQKEKAGRRIYLQKANDRGVIIIANNFPVLPGDTLVLRSSDSPFSYIYLGGIQGTADHPIVVINEGGQAFLEAGFDLENCRHIIVSGSGSKDIYGFLVLNSTGVAIGIHGLSADIEVSRFDAEECSFGCWIKNEANCDPAVNNWVLDHISVHDFKLTHCRIEGFYMGSTDANNASRPVNCNGINQNYRPSRLGNIKIYNGIIDGTGRPAVMLSNAAVGVSEIYNNTISNVGREYNDQQGTGISLGLYTRAYVHNNKIKNTFTWGIASLGGAGLIRIENNTIDSSGYLDGKVTAWAQNIFLDTRPTQPVDSTQFRIMNNITRHPGPQAENIRVLKTLDSYSSDNTICHNSSLGGEATIMVEKGIRWKKCGLMQKDRMRMRTKILIASAITFPLVALVLLLLRRRAHTGMTLQY